LIHNKAYLFLKYSHWLPRVLLKGTAFCYFLLFSLDASLVSAQEILNYEETSVSLKIPKIGVVEVPVYVRDEALFLPIADIFTFLKIQNISSEGYDTVSGFFINQKNPYVIDRALNRIQYQDKVFTLNEGDLVRTETDLYLRSDYFGKVFGLNITFDFRSLTAVLSTNFELPIIREMRLELMRSNLSRLKGEIKADTTIGRKYSLFHFGMADWSIVATQQISGRTNFWLNLGLGSVIAGGEANILLTYNNQQQFSWKNQYFLWHWANNEHRALRQVMLGKVATTATATIFAPMVGMQFTNTPTTFRRTFGSYTLTDYTEPGWVVELYVNNVLVDYVKADASGFFTFEVPLVYGTSSVLLRFYGPWGEERSREQRINIPFNFLPSKKLEYTVTACMLEDSKNNVFSRANLNYGLNQRVTIGGGVEYLSSVRPGSTMPFINLSARVASSLLIFGEYSYGLKFKGILSYRLPGNIQLQLNYIKYHKGQTAISTSLLEERKMMISVPVSGKRFTSLVRLTLDQVLINNFSNLNSELLISVNAFGVSTNLTTFGIFYDHISPYIYSILSVGCRLPGHFILVPQVQYDLTHSRLVSMRVDVERQMFEHGQLKLTYENNLAVNIQSIQVGMRYNFPFAQTGVTAIYGNNNTSFSQTARGSLMFDGQTEWVGSSNMTNVGKGGLVIIPYLDMNANSRRDPDEPKLSGLNVRITGGRMEKHMNDSTIRVVDLEPFTNYFIELDKSSFDNVSWQIKKPLISVAIDPNQFKLVEVPVAVYGEASGMVYVKKDVGLIGQGRIIIRFYREDSTLVGQTLTEADGYFSYLGLAPGNYFVRIDNAQLKEINMSVAPESAMFTIARIPEGDLAGGLDFVLTPKGGHVVADSASGQEERPAQEISIPQEVVKFPVDTLTKPPPVTSPPKRSGLTVQAGAFRNQTNAINARYRIQTLVTQPVFIEYESGFYKVRIGSISTADSARQLIINLSGHGFPGSFILKKP